MRIGVGMGVLAAAVLGLGGAWAQPLRTGIFEKPPYAIRQADGSWRGLGVELWEAAAREAGLEWGWVEVAPGEIADALEQGKLDAVAGMVPMSAALERRIEFTLPWLASSTGLVVAGHRGLGGMALLEACLSADFAKLVAALLAFLLLASLLVWLAERRHEDGHFAGTAIEGLGSAIWFAATTITTVGYGDKTPRTPRGRALVIVLMFCGVLIVAGFTGAVASLTTSARLQNEIRGFEDLPGRLIGAPQDGPARSALQAMGIQPVLFPTMDEALRALTEGRIAAVAGDRNLLAWYLQHRNLPGLRLLAARARQFGLSVALPPNSPHLRALNLAILEVIESQQWNASLRYWLGPGNSPARESSLADFP